MLKKTITYTDYDGNERTEDFYFNLTKAELTEMEVSTDGGLEKELKRIAAARDGAAVMAFFKDLLLRSYGEKSPDGKRFVKTPELSAAFSQTEAYSELFMELVLNADKAGEFTREILPKTV